MPELRGRLHFRRSARRRAVGATLCVFLVFSAFLLDVADAEAAAGALETALRWLVHFLTHAAPPPAAAGLLGALAAERGAAERGLRAVREAAGGPAACSLRKQLSAMRQAAFEGADNDARGEPG